MLVFVPALVTVAFAPLPLPQALARISDAVGTTLACAPALREEVLVARLKDADPERVKREIATLFDASWKEEQGKIVLLPDPKAVRLHAARRDAKAARTLDGSLAYLERRLAEQPSHLGLLDAKAYELKKAREDERRKQAMQDQDWANAFTFSTAAEETPGWRAAARLTLLLGRSSFLTLPNRSRTVWATRPTPMQSSFSVGAKGPLAEYAKELAAFKPKAEVARVRLIATRWESGGAFNVQFEALDDVGTVVDGAFLRMNDDADRMRKRSTVFDAPPPLDGEKPLPLTPEEREHQT